MIKYAVWLFPLVILPSCIAPTHHQPVHLMPEQFERTCGTLSCEPLCQWWHQFHDSMLNDLIVKAVENNYDLNIARERIEESRALYQFKKAQLFPQINGVSTVRHTRFSQALAQTSFLTDPNVSFFQFGTDAFWELDFWGRLRHEKNAQFLTFQAQIESMRDVQVIIIAEVARNYIDYSAIMQKIRLLKQKINVDRKLVQLQKDLFLAGLSSEIELTQQQQILATSLDQLEQFHTAAAQIKHQLAVLLGINPEQLSLPCFAKRVPLSQYRIAVGIPSDIIRRRPDIRQTERLLAASNESIGAAIAEWFPRFTLFGGISSQASNGSNWFSSNSLTWHIGPSVHWPIINFGRIKANIKVQESKKRQAALRYSNTIINALKDVEDFLAAYCYTKEELFIIAQKYKQAAIEADLVQSKFIAGLVNELSSLNAQSNRITVALEVTDISQALSTSLTGLYKALGGGW